jgi:hypothetical protein
MANHRCGVGNCSCSCKNCVETSTAAATGSTTVTTDYEAILDAEVNTVSTRITLTNDIIVDNISPALTSNSSLSINKEPEYYTHSEDQTNDISSAVVTSEQNSTSVISDNNIIVETEITPFSVNAEISSDVQQLSSSSIASYNNNNDIPTEEEKQIKLSQNNESLLLLNETGDYI